MLVATLAVAAPPPLAASLLASIAQVPPVSVPFVQVSYRGVLDRPLIVTGSLRWLGGDQLQREIDTPFKETAKITDGEISVQRGDGKVHRLPLSRVPQTAALLAGFRALLGGDVQALQQDFALAAEGDDARWVITLTPRTAALKRKLASIVIDGRAHQPRCLTMHDANGDTAITLVGAMARQGLQSAAPLESALAARCRNH